MTSAAIASLLSKTRAAFGFLGGVLAAAVWLGAAPAQAAPPAACLAGQMAMAAGANAVSVNGLAWAPFRRPETGWATYEPLIAHEIGTNCAAGTPVFAGALARWQKAHGLGGAGVFDEATFERLKAVWQSRRPFVTASRHACPAPPTPGELAQADARASYGGKTILLVPGALAAYRQMAAAARREVPEARRDGRLLTIFSGFRSPAADDARCALELNCQGVVRATCSAHRTGKALDLFLGAAPGYGPDSSADPNRLFMVRSATYRWLVANAARFGFVNYAFEPWHWEWTG